VNQYSRLIHGAVEGKTLPVIVDVYDVLKAFGVTCPATAHAAKKLLCAGIRGHKSRRQDLIEAKIAIERAIEMEGTNGTPSEQS
jgi:hypothetical protein